MVMGVALYSFVKVRILLGLCVGSVLVVLGTVAEVELVDRGPDKIPAEVELVGLVLGLGLHISRSPQ